MGYEPIEDYLPQANWSIYKLVRMAAIRALELADGKPSLIEKGFSEKLTTVALEEIKRNKVLLDEDPDLMEKE